MSDFSDDVEVGRFSMISWFLIISFAEIRSGTVPSHIVEGYGPDGVSQKVNFSKEALNQLGIFVESRIHVRVSLFHELSKLMSRLELIVDFTEFSRFYDFVFFVCRENGQKNITVSKAVSGWRLVLSGRFQLLTQFCDFVEVPNYWTKVLHLERLVSQGFSSELLIKLDQNCGDTSFNPIRACNSFIMHVSWGSFYSVL